MRALPVLPLLVVSVAAFVACAPAAPECGARRTADVPPEEQGPFLAGLRTWDLTYDAPGGVGPRTIKAYAWYPTLDPEASGTTYVGLWPDPQSLENAKPEPPLDGCSYPVLVNSHGSQGFAGGSAHLMRRAASHGWVALGVDHTGNTIIDNLDPRPISTYFTRALDLSAVLDAVAALPDTDPLSKADVSRVVATGHSFGTHTVWSLAGAAFDMSQVPTTCVPNGSGPEGACSEAELAVFAAGLSDARVVGIVPMAGSPGTNFFGVDGLKSAKVPVFQMTGSEDDVGAAGRWDDLVGLDAAWIELAGGCHETFNLGTCATLEREAGFRVVDAYAFAFARRHVLNDISDAARGLVDGERPLSSIVTYRRR